MLLPIDTGVGTSVAAGCVLLPQETAKAVMTSEHISLETAFTDTDISGEDASVQAVCNAVWTSSVKEAYRVTQVGIRSEGL